MGVLLLVTVIGLIALWPSPRASARPSQAFGGSSLPATVLSSTLVRCLGPTAQQCRRITIKISGGRTKGQTTPITLGPVTTAPDVSAGAHIRVTRVSAPGATQGEGPEPYSFVDYDRHGSLLWLAIAFGLLAVVLARWRGTLALVGVVLSLLLVTKFIVPAILAGSSPLLVSLVGSLAVMFLTVGLTNGVGVQSLAAALGIGTSLLLATLLGDAYGHIAHLNGYSSELSTVLRQFTTQVSLEGVVIAGIVIGALGVLADMGVSQASAVMALRRANPKYSARELYNEAFTVGRDHLAATIHTLVLAYVGASLPLLLVLQSAHAGFFDAVNTQDIAEPIIATLVGSIALIAAVPLTTGLTALLAAQVPATALPDAQHVHAH
ncbi:MAG TPA: YibE/F family protein [Thermoleophilaceae bacterium]